MSKYVAVKTTWTDAMKEFAEVTLSKKLDRLVDDPLSSEVKVTLVKDNVKVDISCESYRAQAVSDDFYVAMAEAAQKLKTIITKSKHSKKHRIEYEQLTISPEFDAVESLISKEKSFVLDPISIEDAIDEFNDTDYPFYVFRDADENNEVAVLYRRADDTYGVIRCK